MEQEHFSLKEVFTPNSTPSITYVDRGDLNLESRLRDSCELDKMVISISGPSKSGKTVLINKVIDEEQIIRVIGAGIREADDLWNRVLQWMGSPTSSTISQSSGSQIAGSVRVGGEAGIPLVTKGKTDASASMHKNNATSSSRTFNEGGLTQVIKEIADSDFLIFLDDFHYISEELREEIGKQIKVASDNGVKMITASVPHRADDVVRSNSELRGRVAAIDIAYWNTEHLLMIATQGFAALNASVDPALLSKMANEAMGSPQLMQTICYNLCLVLDLRTRLEALTEVDVSEEQLSDALTRTSEFTDFSKMLSVLHSGPKKRGQERKEHDFIDSTQGDVYRAVLLAIKANPIATSFSYDEITQRVKKICTGDTPSGSSLTSCLAQMHALSEDLQPGKPVLAWDEDTLDIADPYFAFFLRQSENLNKLANS